MSQEMSEHNVQSDSSREAMNITLLAGGWTSSTSGLATLNRELAIHLSQHPKVEVCLLVPEGHCTDEDKSEAKKHGITVVSANKLPGYDEPLDWLGAPPKGHKMDVVVGHGAKLGRQVQFIKQSPRFHNCKWVQMVHTAPEDLSRHKGCSDQISEGEKKHEVEVELCQVADLIVPVGPRLEELYSSYLQRYKRNIFPVIPGLFDREFGGLEQSPNENAEFKVLLCGRGDEEDFELKGCNLAAKAFTDHRLQRKNYSLLFVGAPEGKQEEVRQRLLQCGIAQEQLTVRKFVQSREKMMDLLCEVNLAIMPSRSEGFGLVALEALSAGLPILVNSKSGFARVLEKILFGDSCIVNSDEPAKWAEAIEGVRFRHGKRLEEIKVLRASYNKQYSWKEQCENFVERLWTVVHGCSPGSVKIPRADPPVQGQSAVAAPDRILSGEEPSSDQEKKGSGASEEDELSSEQSLQKERKRKASGSTFDLERLIRLIISAHDLDDEEKEEMYEILLHNGQRYLNRRKLSGDVLEKGVNFFEYLTETFRVNLVCVVKSSLEIVMLCPTLESLEKLWRDYDSGHLNIIAQALLVTDEIKRKLNLEIVRLTTTIEKENYLMCKKVLMEMSEPGEPSRRNQEGRERPLPGPEGSQGACGTAANAENPGNNFGQPTQAQRGRERGASRNHVNGRGASLYGRGMPSAYERQEGRPGKANATFSNQNSNTTPHPRGVVSGKGNILDLKDLKEKEAVEVVYRLNEGMARLKFLLRSQEDQHNSVEFVSDLICILAVACRAPSGKNTNKILAALKGSVFFTLKLPRFLCRMQVSMGLNDKESRRKFIECLIVIFTKYLRHLPSSYAALPYVQLELALDQSNIHGKEELQKELDAFKQERDDIIRAERQKHGKRYINRMGEKPPNDFRDIPICPTNKEITTQERPFLRKNITKGRYENTEHYLDVQFRLLREDFLKPLREGIHEIVQNIPRPQRKQLMKNYRNVRITNKKFTWSGIIHQVQIDVSGVDTCRWAHSKRLIYGSFVCLSKDNFKTMLFATVAERKPEDLKRGRIEIRFVEEQNVSGIENYNSVYQMVESPAYFEAYRYVLKGLKELDETTLPFKKYLVECSEEVDPPEYLRSNDAQEEPVCYDLSKALDVRDAPNATSVPVLDPGAWPSVKDICLNNSQLEALRTATTTEFSVIQGPPGTGKTYVGAKIVRCLLDNRTAWDPERNSPMLMVCYTNHALDQFLEKVLEFLPSQHIIRVGGRSRSENLEACDLKKFSYRYRMYEERDQVKDKMTENDTEITKFKEYLAKADKEPLKLQDLEDLMHSTHVDQMYNAKFPSNVANECRNPANTFQMWLCNHEEVNSCNQSTKAPINDEIKEQPDGGVLEEYGADEDSEVFYDAVLSSILHTGEHTKDSELRKSATEVSSAENFVHVSDNSKEDDVSKVISKTCLEPKEHSSEEQVLMEDYYNSSLSKTETEGSRGVATNLDVTISEVSGVMEEASSIGRDKHPTAEEGKTGEKVNEASYVDEETIAIEREADLIQYQRTIQGDEYLLMAITEQTANSVDEVKDQARKDEETDDGFITVSYRKKGKAKVFPWQMGEDGNFTEESKDAHEMFEAQQDDGMVTTNSKKKKTKKKKKKKDSKVVILGDISKLKTDLEKEKMMSSDEAMSVTNIWNLSQSDRFRLYLFWIENYRDRYRVEIQRCEQKYTQLCEELEVVRFQEEEQVIRRAAVVGMTTSSAARYHSMLQRVAPRIVVIEEAAEVMEAHIVTSLSHNTKHTILIGDHKQLRPKATVYEIAQKYNLEVSLFERMVMNGMECKRLSIQHRMRPEIAALTKRIYDHEIMDDDSVCHFPDIAGVCHNLHFIDHSQPERVVGGLQSYANQHEAEFLVALCNYLLLQGYNKEQITILTMYTGQLLLLQGHMPRRKFQGVKVCAVDNFQGEENDIILLSLVRSNSEGRIGFLGESNRICVALSRARQGLYCIGNFSLLKSKSKLWNEICDDLKAKDGIGDSLQLICKTHNNVTIARKASDFNPSGGCNMPCAVRLPCGHACDRECHTSSHLKDECRKKCLESCPNEHPCLLWCHYPTQCPKCRRNITKTVPKCGHEQQIPCSVNPEQFSCRLKCEKILPCGHDCAEECGQDCTSQCKVRCIKLLPCGHPKHLLCYKDPMDFNQCNENCSKVLDCGHLCSKKCREICECGTQITVHLPCEHTKTILCREKNSLIAMKCYRKCKRTLRCGHDCAGVCYEECAMKQCKIDVAKDLPCGHQQRIPCYQDPQSAVCSAPCPRQLDCGHKCSSWCGLPCQVVQCDKLCQTMCKRGHSCQQRCHFGSRCGDCMTEVNVTIPGCGHVVTKPCHVDPGTLRCEQRCQRLRACGHPCKQICSQDCEAWECKVLVARRLSCNHVVYLECHKNPETFNCKEMVHVHLPCGHQTSLECHVAKAGLENVPCKTRVEKELPCKHKFALPCYIITAGLRDVSCTVKVPRTLPCTHKTILPCHVNHMEHFCEEEVEIKLPCGHTKVTICGSVRSEMGGWICNTNVMRKLLCGHEKEMHCSDKPEKAFCDAPCERFLPCGHACPNKCGDDCTSFKCVVAVEKDLSCGHHKLRCLCSEDVSHLRCLSQCKRKLECGHRCPGKCDDDCSQYKCQKIVVKKLDCAGHHVCQMPCSKDPNDVTCQKRCRRNLECGHPCPGICSEPCESMKCQQLVEKQYPCTHKELLVCFQSKIATCRAPCRRRKRCKHMCQGVCGDPCSNYPCGVLLTKTLSCGHRIKMPCNVSVDDVQCPAPCATKLKCGHQCSGTCGNCQQRSSHEICRYPCSRVLVCLHRCKATCSEPCPPCDKECTRRCPHKRCTNRCSQLCEPCTKPCVWSCPHYQCNNPCGEECDRPRCDAPCPKILPCRHLCIGLCGENCPTICAICHAKKLVSMPGNGRLKPTEATRYLQLFDCGHILRVEEMDSWIMQGPKAEVQLIQCPRCSMAITFSFRYGNVIKRTLKNKENALKEMYDLANETCVNTHS